MDLAKQCNDHAAAIRRLGERYGRAISEPSESKMWDNIMTMD